MSVCKLETAAVLYVLVLKDLFKIITREINIKIISVFLFTQQSQISPGMIVVSLLVLVIKNKLQSELICSSLFDTILTVWISGVYIPNT